MRKPLLAAVALVAVIGVWELRSIFARASRWPAPAAAIGTGADLRFRADRRGRPGDRARPASSRACRPGARRRRATCQPGRRSGPTRRPAMLPGEGLGRSGVGPGRRPTGTALERRTTPSSGARRPLFATREADCTRRDYLVADPGVAARRRRNAAGSRQSEGRGRTVAQRSPGRPPRLAFLEAQARADEVRIAQARVTAAKAHVELAAIQADHTRLRPDRGGGAQSQQQDGRAGRALLAGNRPSFWPTRVDTTSARSWKSSTPRVAAGMAVQVHIDGFRGGTLRGRVVHLSPRMERKSLWSERANERYDMKTREVRIELEPAQSLIVGLRVEVMINTEVRVAQNASRVPAKTDRPR